jgi:hypothetical protein
MAIVLDGTSGVDQGGVTGATQLPSGTTAQRPSTLEAGLLRFNTDTGQMEEYTGTAWVSKASTGKSIAMAIVFGG